MHSTEQKINVNPMMCLLEIGGIREGVSNIEDVAIHISVVYRRDVICQRMHGGYTLSVKVLVAVGAYTIKDEFSTPSHGTCGEEILVHVRCYIVCLHNIYSSLFTQS